MGRLKLWWQQQKHSWEVFRLLQMERLTRWYLSTLYDLEKPAHQWRIAQQIEPIIPPDLDLEDEQDRYNYHER